MESRQYAGVTHARLRKAAQGAGPSAKWVQCRRWVTVGGLVMAECEPVSDAGGWTKADKFARHIAAANPAAVLAMLARIDELEGQLAAAAITADTVAREAVAFMNQRDKLLAALDGLTADVQGLIEESHGVAGLHLNGDVAPWHELESGGKFERLSSLPAALSAIADASAWWTPGSDASAIAAAKGGQP